MAYDVSYGSFDFPPNPDIAGLLAQAVAETDPVIQAQLYQQAYRFTAPLTNQEKTLFAYMEDDYIENNPGLVGNRETSYVGPSTLDDLTE
jgi:hypothetical protein